MGTNIKNIKFNSVIFHVIMPSENSPININSYGYQGNNVTPVSKNIQSLKPEDIAKAINVHMDNLKDQSDQFTVLVSSIHRGNNRIYKQGKAKTVHKETTPQHLGSFINSFR